MLLLLVSTRSVNIRLWENLSEVVPTSLVSAIRGKIEKPDSGHAGLQTAEGAFTELNELTVADIKLMRLVCTLLLLLSLVMVGCAVSPVYEGISATAPTSTTSR